MAAPWARAAAAARPGPQPRQHSAWSDLLVPSAAALIATFVLLCYINSSCYPLLHSVPVLIAAVLCGWACLVMGPSRQNETWHQELVRASESEAAKSGAQGLLKLRVAALIVRATVKKDNAIPLVLQASLMSGSYSELQGEERLSSAIADGGAALPAGARAFCRTWRVVSTQNYDAYLKKLGISWSVRQIACRIMPEPTYSIQEGVLHSTTPGVAGKTMHDVFQTGKEIEIKMMGYRVLVTYKWAEDELVATMYAPDGSLANGEQILVRRWVDPATGELVAVSTCGGVTCERRYCPREDQ